MTGESERATVGLLEMLWHATEQWHDDGAIGRWSDARIAGAIDWHGDARQIVMALVETGWLDEVQGPDRLVVHDWLCHCSSHVWDRVRRRVRRAIEAGTAPAWAASAYAKACDERRRNGGGESDDAQGERSSDPRQTAAVRGGRDKSQSGPGGKRPGASGNVRERPATAPPYPRPKTQDPDPSDPGSDGEEADASADAASTASDPPDGDGGAEESGDAVIRFACTGRPMTWSLTAEHLAALQEQWPQTRVRECLENLAARQAHETSLRRSAGAMPGYLSNWLKTESKSVRLYTATPDAPAPQRAGSARAMSAAEKAEQAVKDRERYERIGA